MTTPDTFTLLLLEGQRKKLHRALSEIASTSPVARPLPNGECERCIHCRALIDTAREALGQQAWPAPSTEVKP